METKGICSLCGNTVFGHQERGKDQKGSYFHMSCVGVSAAGTHVPHSVAPVAAAAGNAAAQNVPGFGQPPAGGGFGGGGFGQTAFGGSTFGTFRTFRKSAQNFGSRYSRAVTADDDRPFIVLTETNLALAVYLFGSVLSLPD